MFHYYYETYIELCRVQGIVCPPQDGLLIANGCFLVRLKDYPHYCQHLASIPHFMEFPPSLIEYIEYGQQSREPILGGRNIQVSKSKKRKCFLGLS